MTNSTPAKLLIRADGQTAVWRHPLDPMPEGDWIDASGLDDDQFTYLVAALQEPSK